MVKSKHQKKTKRCGNTEQYDFMLPGTNDYGVYHSSASAKICICISELKISYTGTQNYARVMFTKDLPY